jgi:metallo-beta-lactamase class B
VEEGGRTYDALIVCGFVATAALVDNPDYPEIAADMAATLAKARTIPVDVFLAAHTNQFGLVEKHAKLATRGPNDPNPYLDRAGYLAYVDMQEQRFKQMLAEQQARAREAAPAGAHH